MEIVDVLRGLAALAVTWFHLTNAYEFDWVRASGHYGWLGVEVFFVISGFVVPYALARKAGISSAGDFGRFMLRRMVRLEPPYIASILLTILLAYASQLFPGFRGDPFQIDIGRILSHFLYLVPLTDHHWLSPVYWTLACEFAFYILCGLLFGIVSEIPGSWRWYALAAGLAALSFGPLPVRALLFVMGIAVFRRLALGEPKLVTLLTIAVSGASIAVNGQDEIAAVGAATALIILFLAPMKLPSCALLRAALWLGTISYSLYLIHVPVGGRVVNLGMRVFEGPVQEFLLSCLALTVSLAFAAMFWRTVESPALGAASRIGPAPAGRRALP